MSYENNPNMNELLKMHEKTIGEIVKKELIAQGFTGLTSEACEHEGCPVDDLFACGSYSPENCKATRRDFSHDHDESYWSKSKTIESCEYKNRTVPLNRHHTNADIEWHLFDDDTMRELGFTDFRKTHWYYCRTVGEQTTFNVTIPKADVDDDLEVSVLDEQFCQPYDYQYLLESNPKNKFARDVREEVERQMLDLSEKGIIRGHTRLEYI